MDLKLIIDGKEFELVEIDSHSFTTIEKKSDSPMPLLPSKDGWNDPNKDTIERTYKSIRVGLANYGMKPVINKTT